MTRRRPLSVRFWEKVDASGDCWDWTGALTQDGYGAIGEGGREGRTLMAHRVVFQLLGIAIPEGMEADHLCFRRRCVNPDHIEVVTPLENKLRQRRFLKTSCIRGHEMSGRNLVIEKSGRRNCRTCKNRSSNESARRARARRAA
jgi:hypothetical protein